MSTNGSTDGREPLRPNRSEGGGLAISVVGCSYLGAVHAACMAALERRLASTEARVRDLGITATVNLDDSFRPLINWWVAGRALESASAGALV